MARPLNQQVVVITGASSGIGRETATKLAGRGARVVLAARSEDSLLAIADQIESSGGRATVIPTDVADWNQVQSLAPQTAGRFGRIDSWVTDAASSQYATVADSTMDEIERIIRVNLLGQIHGMKAALPFMKQQGRGTIVNVASVLGKLSVPLQAAYCASKHGIIGFADSLRLELARDGSEIAVVTVMPSSINTPFFDHARARLGGKRPMPLPPVYDPSAVAHAIAHVCEHPQRDVVVGGAGKLFTVMSRISPALLDALLLFNDSGAKWQTSDRPDDGRDDLFQPLPGVHPARGEWGDEPWSLGDSLYTRWVELHPTVKLAAAGAALAGAVGLVNWFTSRRDGYASPRRAAEALPFAG
jgi:short-subunit dehydrogenase